MTRRRFYAPTVAFSADEKSVVLDAAETVHLRDVLRLQIGAEVFVFDGTGREFSCAVAKIGRNSSDLNILSEVDPSRPESPLNLTLGVALLKHEKFDLVVQKATELGVNRIMPVTSERADVRPRLDDHTDKRMARWQRIALEAAKQSGRARVPEVALPVSFASFTSALGEFDLALMFAERAGQSLASIYAAAPNPVKTLGALIGPEGGWTDEEIESAHEAGWGIATLGGRIMRAETAAIAVVTLLQHQFGDLS